MTDSLKAPTVMNNSLHCQVESMVMANFGHTFCKYENSEIGPCPSNISKYFTSEDKYINDEVSLKSSKNFNLLEKVKACTPVAILQQEGMTLKRTGNTGYNESVNSDRETNQTAFNDKNITAVQDGSLLEKEESFRNLCGALVKLEITPDLPYDFSGMCLANSHREINPNNESLESFCPLDQSSNSGEFEMNFISNRSNEEMVEDEQNGCNTSNELQESNARPRGIRVEVNRPFKCRTCKKKFQKKEYLLNHEKDCNNQCKFCLKRFPTTNNLDMHMKTHTGIEPFECYICNKTFIRSDRLQTHMWRHSRIKPFRCNLCEKTFFNVNSLKIHELMHTVEKPYKCYICKKQFVRADRLQTHLRIHTGEKPFTCDHCSKTLNKADILKTHLRTHTGKKPFEREVCKKRFTQLSTLKGHMLIHTGGKPYRCQICERKF